MAHFAKVENGIVTSVIVADQEFINTGALGNPASWIQTSYNTKNGVHYGPDGQPDGGEALRKNYAGIGHIYDPFRDAFYPQSPYPSWILDEEIWEWKSPVEMPDDGKNYRWNEEVENWVEVTE